MERMGKTLSRRRADVLSMVARKPKWKSWPTGQLCRPKDRSRCESLARQTLGSQRVGPDLADAGARLPDANWHLRHLYAPRIEVKGSVMPPYRFLFEKRRVGHSPSPEALARSEEH